MTDRVSSANMVLTAVAAGVVLPDAVTRVAHTARALERYARLLDEARTLPADKTTDRLNRGIATDDDAEVDAAFTATARATMARMDPNASRRARLDAIHRMVTANITNAPAIITACDKSDAKAAKVLRDHVWSMEVEYQEAVRLTPTITRESYARSALKGWR